MINNSEIFLLEEKIISKIKDSNSMDSEVLTLINKLLQLRNGETSKSNIELIFNELLNKKSNKQILKG